MSNEPEFDKRYNIPKRKADSDPCDNPISTAYTTNYYYGNQGHWQPGATYTQYPTYYPPIQYPRFGPTNPVEPITQNIYNTLTSIKEKPKGAKRDIYKETVPDVDDSSLPKELTAMFQPLYCKLCAAHLSSNIMAKLHYKSKNHEKKIRKFLIEHAQKTGEPLHKRARMAGTPKTEEEKDPKWFHCDVCDIDLTGKMHAESHYMGKHHQKALMGYKKPAGYGYYDADGKWVRQAKAKKLILKDGEDTFGMDFKKKEETKATPEVVAPPSTSNPPCAPGKFTCDVCNVNTTCQEQLDMHLKGQKHQKKLKLHGILPVNTPQLSAISPGENINLSVYRTPSGDFYCPICNLTLNAEPPFKSHLKSKGHMKKSSQNYRNSLND